MQILVSRPSRSEISLNRWSPVRLIKSSTVLWVMLEQLLLLTTVVRYLSVPLIGLLTPDVLLSLSGPGLLLTLVAMQILVSGPSRSEISLTRWSPVRLIKSSIVLWVMLEQLLLLTTVVLVLSRV